VALPILNSFHQSAAYTNWLLWDREHIVVQIIAEGFSGRFRDSKQQKHKREYKKHHVDVV